MAATAAHHTPRTRIYLSGSLARKFFRYKDYQLDSGCANEGFKALKNTVDGFAAEVARLAAWGCDSPFFETERTSARTVSG